MRNNDKIRACVYLSDGVYIDLETADELNIYYDEDTIVYQKSEDMNKTEKGENNC